MNNSTESHERVEPVESGDVIDFYAARRRHFEDKIARLEAENLAELEELVELFLLCWPVRPDVAAEVIPQLLRHWHRLLPEQRQALESVGVCAPAPSAVVPVPHDSRSAAALDGSEQTCAVRAPSEPESMS